ncbi:MAG: hypothetical protein AB7N80_01605 [Bdellovibrionales bacterium]
MNVFKRFILSLMILSFAASAVSCRQSDMRAAGIGALVGLLVVSAMTEQRYYSMPPAPRYVPRYSYCQQYVAQGYMIQHTPYGYYMVYQGYEYRVHCMSNQQVPEAISNEALAQVLESDKNSVDQLLAALKAGQDGDFAAIDSIGLSDEDLLALSRFQRPSEEGITILGHLLNHESRQITVRVLDKLLESGRQMQQVRQERDSA